ncbi:MAG: hypothetical protein P4L84_02015 [Isosphaeraceae bacterium]|nr:hypothetical protein [Isosphaeraceae bacterium]
MSSTNPTAVRGKPPGRAPRILFLDDDPRRAEIFLAENPSAVWVQTVTECITQLAERWDEVHLDHDLGGEQFVAVDREDCGMEVVRWLCLGARPHLLKTRFYIHSHNVAAGSVMTLQMCGSGYWAEFRPFGQPSHTGDDGSTEMEAYRPRGFRARLLELLRRFAR